MSRTIIIVQSCPGREPITRATLDALDDLGGVRQLGDDVPRFLWWSGHQSPPPVPSGWILVHNATGPHGHRRDLWRLLNFAHGYGDDTDLVCFEDDVVPCRNAVAFMVKWPAYAFTTFYPLQPNVWGRYGLRAIERKWGFWGTQAFKVPARILGRLVAAGETDPKFPREGGDTRIGKLLAAWGESIHYHRPLVQHVGAVSVHLPGATLTGHRAQLKDFDPALDALTLACNG